MRVRASYFGWLLRFLARPLLILSVQEVLEISAATSLTQPRGRWLTVIGLLEIYLNVALPINQRRGLLVRVCCHYHSPILLCLACLARCLSIQVKVAGSRGGVQACVHTDKPRCLAIEFVAS